MGQQMPPELSYKTAKSIVEQAGPSRPVLVTFQLRDTRAEASDASDIMGKALDVAVGWCI
jgi:hypothetical protein